jgi:septum formation protein
MSPLILASQSPRRRELLAALGVPFEVAASDVEEMAWPGETPAALVQRLARSKAQAVADRYPGRIVLGADTVVVLDDIVLGKPADAAEAMTMLRSLRGRSHLVLSAVYALNVAAGQEAAALHTSLVWMRDYGDAEVAAYIASGDPLDKAGAYAIQNPSFAPVAAIEGCFSSVMGFPLAEVAHVLEAVGVIAPVSAISACQPHAGRCCQETGDQGNPCKLGALFIGARAPLGQR